MPYNPNDILWRETDYMNELLQRADKLPDPKQLSTQESSVGFRTICDAYRVNFHYTLTTTDFFDAQLAVYNKLKEKAVNSDDFKSLMGFAAWLGEEFILMQKAAARGDIFLIRRLAGAILMGQVETTELSISWALQAISYVETAGLSKYLNDGKPKDTEQVISLAQAISRTKDRIVGLDQSPMPAVGTERFEKMVQDTMEALLKAKRPPTPDPFFILDELKELNTSLFDFVAPPPCDSIASGPSSSSAPSAGDRPFFAEKPKPDSSFTMSMSFQN